MFGQVMGESVVSVFFYIGIGSVILTSAVIGIILLEPVIENIRYNIRKKSHLGGS